MSNTDINIETLIDRSYKLLLSRWDKNLNEIHTRNSDEQFSIVHDLRSSLDAIKQNIEILNDLKAYSQLLGDKENG